MIGEILRKRREALRLDLREVAGSLRIRHEYLKALEENAAGKLPAAVYTKGYIRAYAQFLGIDPNPLIAAYSGQQAEADPEPRPEPVSSKGNAPLRKVLLAVPLLIVLCLGLFFLLSRATPQKQDRTLEVTAPQAHKESRLPEVPVAPSNQARPFSDGRQQGYMLHVTAVEKTWLRVEIDAGRFEEALLKPGESKEWRSQTGFNLKIGNAGGIRLMLNDKDLGTPGEKGEVLRIRLPKEESPTTTAAR